MQTPQTVPVLSGGMREILSDFSKKQKSQFDTFFGVGLLLAIVFVHEIGLPIRNQLDTLLGRLLAFGLVVLITDQVGWIHGLLAALFFALVLSLSTNPRPGVRPSVPTEEGFAPDYQVRLVPPKKQKWWVEEVMKENPIGIEDEKVSTMAVQDDQASNRSSQQDTKSSSQ
jgi:hypothetical protein